MAADDALRPAMDSRSSADSVDDGDYFDRDYFDHTDVSETLAITVRQPQEAVLVIEVAGELDMLTGSLLEKRLGEFLRARPERLIIDLSEVAFLGSAGLAALLGARRIAIEQDTKLQLRGTSHRTVARPLQITCLDRLFETL